MIVDYRQISNFSAMGKNSAERNVKMLVLVNKKICTDLVLVYGV
jgi:hypothetical protein